MATIYSDQYAPLRTLLASAGKTEDATLLIPDLQRPYVWQPSQVVVLVDSLIRGWPFGTLLTWKVKPDDPARELARSFWRIVDRVGNEDGNPISMKHPPATFQMVLDGQQRIQSLLLALGGDGWGFKLLDRQWHEYVNGTKPRGQRGKAHWSLGCLCVDISELSSEYASVKRATAIDYTKILKWVVTDSANGQSHLEKPQNYVEPLPIASKVNGKFVRVARLWEAAPDQSIDNYEAEEIAERILLDHYFQKEECDQLKRSVGALIIALREVKQTRVTYLELSEYQEAYGKRDAYNDAIVNIFTRLNTAGRTLTREDITFAWLKVGWKTELTKNESAKACFDALAEKLNELGIPLSVEDVISAISFVWSTSFNDGKLLTNNDLMRGDAIRPMAENVSKNWSLVVDAAERIAEHARDRGLRFRDQYQSVNSLAYLWAWYFNAIRWESQKNLKETQKDSYEKHLSNALDKFIDRWLICSQWAGVWSLSNAASISKYAADLAECWSALEGVDDFVQAAEALAAQIEAHLKEIELPAISFLFTMNADDRQQVRLYHTALWVWNRLDKTRWTNAQIGLREKSRRRSTIEVDHIVAYDIWTKKLFDIQKVPLNNEAATKNLAIDEISPRINELGNCMLLEKNFNISKSNRPLKSFLEKVHEFQNDPEKLIMWANALDLDMAQVACDETSIEVLSQLFHVRTKKIRDDLEKFIRGDIFRIDLD